MNHKHRDRQTNTPPTASTSPSPPDHRLRVPDRREHLLHHHLVLAVQVAPHQRAAMVTHDHAVRVEHRDDFEDELTPELLRAKGLMEEQNGIEW